MFFIFMNLFHFLLILWYAAYYGLLGESIQAKFIIHNINSEYDLDVLMSIALVQAGKGTSSYIDNDMIALNTELRQLKILAGDFANEDFGSCYYYQKFIGNRWVTERVSGTLSYKTRKYLLEFKEEHLGIKDPSTMKKCGYKFKKEKVTIK